MFSTDKGLTVRDILAYFDGALDDQFDIRDYDTEELYTADEERRVYVSKVYWGTVNELLDRHVMQFKVENNMLIIEI